MTACVNKNHGRRVAGVVTASLVGALTLGGVSLAAVPTVALAEQAGLQFTAPGDAYTAGEVRNPNFSQGGSAITGSVATFEKNVPVALDSVEVKMNSASSEFTTLRFNAAGVTDNGKYQVKYYAADANDPSKPANDAQEITSDVTAVGRYVAVVTATSGNYADGFVYVPFQIKGVDISSATLDQTSFTYDADAQKVVVKLFGKELIEGEDYTASFYKGGHDLTDANKVDSPTDAGQYTVVINGKDGYEGSKTFETAVTINKLDLASGALFETVVKSGDSEPTAPDAVWVNGERHDANSNLVKKLQAQNPNTWESWGTADDQTFTYEVSPVTKDDPNFTSSKGSVTVRKVASDAAWTYKGQAFPSSYDVIVNDDSTHWDSKKVGATSPDGKTKYDVVKYVVDGSFIDDTHFEPSNWGTTPGKHTVVYVAKDSTGAVVGKSVVTITVYEQAVNADASATLNYDEDGLAKDKDFKVVTSVSKTYDGSDLLAKVTTGTDVGKGAYLRVVVKAKDANDKVIELTEGVDYKVSYYKGDQQVSRIVNAGTYTLKLTSDTYKLSGTTEATITVGKKALSGVVASNVKTREFDDANTTVDYLPWTKAGSSIVDLGLVYNTGVKFQSEWVGTVGPTTVTGYKLTSDTITNTGKQYFYVDPATGKYAWFVDHATGETPADLAIVDGVAKYNDTDYALYEAQYATDSKGYWTQDGANDGKGVDDVPASAFKVTLLKDGQAVEKLTDEGVYTVHFEARNDDAANNYEVPADLTVTVVKDGSNGSANHLRFADVTYRDYFVDAVDAVASKGYMNGYSGTEVFGAQNSLKRGDVAVVLYNLAWKTGASQKLDETNSSYDKVHGYKSFDDVDGTMYYGAAIAWAKQAGVVSGHDGQFRPEDSVSREEFAAMLFNYAKKFGRDASFDADALSKVSDADSVSGWAKDAVSWAVSNKIMGNGGYVSGQSTIKRADTAGMVNNFTK